MTQSITASFYVGDVWKVDDLDDQLPEYMLESGADVRTHTVENIRWGGRRSRSRCPEN